jgi:hypothetical protein
MQERPSRPRVSFSGEFVLFSDVGGVLDAVLFLDRSTRECASDDWGRIEVFIIAVFPQVSGSDSSLTLLSQPSSSRAETLIPATLAASRMTLSKVFRSL